MGDNLQIRPPAINAAAIIIMKLLCRFGGGKSRPDWVCIGGFLFDRLASALAFPAENANDSTVRYGIGIT